MLKLAKISLMVTLAFNCHFPAARAEGPRLASPHFDRVVWIVLENASYKSALQQPFLKGLTAHGVLLANMTAEIHPSQGNYLAMVSGDTFHVTSDQPISITASHLGDLLESHGRSWINYAEQYPGNCFLGSGAGLYARKHVPFLSFVNIQTNPQRCAHVVNSVQFDRDLQSGQLPDFSMYTPDLNHDGHNAGIAAADQWLFYRMGPLLSQSALMQRTLFVITFDEDDLFSGNHIYSLLIGAGLPNGAVVNQPTSHYSLLRLIEDEWGLGTLGRGDLRAAPMTGLWSSARSPTP